MDPKPLFLVLLLATPLLSELGVHAPSALLEHGCGLPLASDGNCTCIWYDPGTWPCCFSKLFHSLAKQVVQHIEGAVRSVVELATSAYRRVIEELVAGPLIAFGCGMPVFEPSLARVRPHFLVPWLSHAMNRVFQASLWAGYGIVGAALLVSGIALIGEAAGVVREGEAMATLKRVFIALPLIYASRYLYDYACLGLAMIDSTILHYREFVNYVEAAVGVLALVGAGLGFLGSFAFVFACAMMAFVLMVLGALRLLLVSVLASLLPVLIALSVFPWEPVRRAGQSLIGMLVNLGVATIVCAAIFALGASTEVRLSGAAGTWVEIVTFFACLAAPALSLVVAPRASIGLYVTSMLLGYAFRPLIARLSREIAPVLGAAVRGLEARGGAAAAIARVVRAAARPPGIAGLAASRILRRTASTQSGAQNES